MTTIADRLKEARRDAGYETASDAAKAFGWNENTYRSNENGQRGVSRKSAIKFAKAYRVSVDWLLTGRGLKRPAPSTGQHGIALRQIPIVRWADITTTTPQTLRSQLLSAEARGFVVVPEVERLSADAFALEVQDDSMIDPRGSPMSIYPGDTVIIDPDREPKAGSTVLARDGKKVVIRRVRIVVETEEGAAARVALVPLNPDYPTKEIDGDGVLGVMAGMYRRAAA